MRVMGCDCCGLLRQLYLPFTKEVEALTQFDVNANSSDTIGKRLIKVINNLLHPNEEVQILQILLNKPENF